MPLPREPPPLTASRGTGCLAPVDSGQSAVAAGLAGEGGTLGTSAQNMLKKCWGENHSWVNPFPFLALYSGPALGPFGLGFPIGK